MWTHLTIISILFLTQPSTPFLQNGCNDQIALYDKSCKTKIDSLTKKLIYTTADILLSNEGGKTALVKKLERQVNIDTAVVENLDTNVSVAFIVDIDGSIGGERIIKDKTNQIGHQMLTIAKTFKWTPAICKGKKITMLYTLTITMDPASE